MRRAIGSGSYRSQAESVASESFYRLAHESRLGLIARSILQGYEEPGDDFHSVAQLE